MFNIGAMLSGLVGGMKSGATSLLSDPTMLLKGGQVLYGAYKGNNQVKVASGISKEMMAKEKAMYEYNKKNLQDAYDSSLQNYYGNYVQERMKITDEYADAKSNLNMLAMQNGVSLADTSYDVDIKDQLDREFNNEMQDSFTNLANKLTKLSLERDIKNTHLDSGLENKLREINLAFDSLQVNHSNKFMGDLINLGTSLYDKHRTQKTIDKLMGVASDDADLKLWK